MTVQPKLETPYTSQKVLYTANDLRRAVSRLAQTIDTAYALENSQPLSLLVVMQGAFHFASDLSRELQTPHQLTFLSAHSYEGQQRCTNLPPTLRWWTHPERLAGRCILLVEDIVDTGHTLAYLTQVLKDKQLDLWASVSLLDKPNAREVSIAPRWSAFTIAPDHFVVGYGLDYQQNYRDLPDIRVL